MSQTEPTNDDMDANEVWQTHIYNPDKEFTVYASVTTESPELATAATKRGETRELILSEGGDLSTGEPVPSQDWPFVQQSAPDANLNRTLVHCAGVAVGYYLHHLETHAIEEEHTYEQMAALVNENGFPLEEFQVFVDSLDESGRKLRALDLLDFRVKKGGDWAAEPYRDTCTWRTTNLSEQGQRFAERLGRELDLNPQHCYRNAQEAIIKHAGNHHVKYFEGIALPKQGCQVSRHAWIEFDGEVIELTWPWHTYDGNDAVYFGTEFDAEEVEETFNRRDGGSQIILSDEQTRKLKQVRSEA